MAKFAFIIEGMGGFADVYLGVSWGDGGINNSAVYYSPAFVGGGFVGFQTKEPISILDGIPGLRGKNAFLDVMGTCLGNSYVYIDFKVKLVNGSQPIYQTQTTSIPIFGICSNSITVNTNINRGGTVGNIKRRQFVAGRMNLINPSDIPQPEPVATEPQQFCGFTRGARLRAALGLCPNQ